MGVGIIKENIPGCQGACIVQKGIMGVLPAGIGVRGFFNREEGGFTPRWPIGYGYKLIRAPFSAPHEAVDGLQRATNGNGGSNG